MPKKKAAKKRAPAKKPAKATKIAATCTSDDGSKWKIVVDNAGEVTAERV